jgi:hypothetical protein
MKMGPAVLATISVLTLAACGTSPSSGTTALAPEGAAARLDAYIAQLATETGDPYCDLLGVVSAVEQANDVATDDANAAIARANATGDGESLAAVNDAGTSLLEVAQVRSLLESQLLETIDDPEAAAAMVANIDVNDNLSLAIGKMLAQATSLRALSEDLTELLSSPETLGYLERQAQTSSALQRYVDERCS